MNTYALLVNSITGMNSKLRKDSLLCCPSEQTGDMKLFNTLSPSRLQELLSNNVTTPEGRDQFVKVYNEIGFANGKLIWNKNDEAAAESRIGGGSPYEVFLAFKRRFDTVNTLMFSMEEGNHRSMSVLFTYALRKLGPEARWAPTPPAENEALTVEFLLEGARDQQLKARMTNKEISTVVSREMVDKVYHDESDQSQLVMSGTFWIPSAANDAIYPVESMLNDSRSDSLSYNESKHSSSTVSSLQKITDLIQRVLKPAKIAYAKGSKKQPATIHFVIDGKDVAEFSVNSLRKEKSKEKMDGASNHLVEMLYDVRNSNDQPVLIEFRRGNEVVKFPFKDDYKTIKKVTGKNCDVTELVHDIVGGEIIKHCLVAKSGFRETMAEKLVRHITKEGLWSLNEDRRFLTAATDDNETIYSGKLGDDTNRGLAAGLMIVSMYTAGLLYDEEERVLEFVDELNRSAKNESFIWENLREYELFQSADFNLYVVHSHKLLMLRLAYPFVIQALLTDFYLP